MQCSVFPLVRTLYPLYDGGIDNFEPFQVHILPKPPDGMLSHQ